MSINVKSVSNHTVEYIIIPLEYEHVKIWVNEWLSNWINEWASEWINERVREYVIEGMNKRE